MSVTRPDPIASSSLRRLPVIFMCLIVTLCAVGGLSLVAAPEESPRTDPDRVVVVTTSLLECAVRDVAGDRLQVRRLIPPKSCPGHFDATPADLDAIARAALFIRHDYQSFLDRRLVQTGRAARRAYALPTAGPQTLPANYAALCRALCDALAESFPAEAGDFRRRLTVAEAAVRAAGEDALKSMAPISGLPVVASRQQKAFCEWAGLRVVAVFDDADQASLRSVEQTVSSAKRGGAKAVVCNLQSGLREGQNLAARINVPAVVLTNFPDVTAPDGGYRAMLLANASALVAGLSRE